VPLVLNLLKSAALTRRRSAASLVVRLEERIDELHHSAASLAELAGHRLREAKLAALAEFAAGAGHEINNPLAVISGNAQRLIRTEQDDDRADALRSIVRQSQRISGILRELMQFARPPQVERDAILVLNLGNAICEDLLPIAEERGVRLELVNAAADVHLHADLRQVRTALAAVVRNAIEATGFGGWVRLHCARGGDGVRFTIEDNGPGLTHDAAEHAFDPFYSGRIAGRGRGLGLSTAWQLARHNGGDLCYEPTVDGPTRFVLTLPCVPEPISSLQRRSA
jgi:signal transduction histidine kinase